MNEEAFALIRDRLERIQCLAPKTERGRMIDGLAQEALEELAQIFPPQAERVPH